MPTTSTWTLFKFCRFSVCCLNVIFLLSIGQFACVTCIAIVDMFEHVLVFAVPLNWVYCVENHVLRVTNDNSYFRFGFHSSQWTFQMNINEQKTKSSPSIRLYSALRFFFFVFFLCVFFPFFFMNILVVFALGLFACERWQQRHFFFVLNWIATGEWKFPLSRFLFEAKTKWIRQWIRCERCEIYQINAFNWGQITLLLHFAVL